jgi:hypothetical protein
LLLRLALFGPPLDSPHLALKLSLCSELTPPFLGSRDRGLTNLLLSRLASGPRLLRFLGPSTLDEDSRFVADRAHTFLGPLFRRLAANPTSFDHFADGFPAPRLDGPNPGSKLRELFAVLLPLLSRNLLQELASLFLGFVERERHRSLLYGPAWVERVRPSFSARHSIEQNAARTTWPLASVTASTPTSVSSTYWTSSEPQTPQPFGAGWSTRAAGDGWTVAAGAAGGEGDDAEAAGDGAGRAAAMGVLSG